MKIGYRWTSYSNDFSYTDVKSGMYLILRCSHLDSNELSEEAKAVFSPYHRLDETYFVEEVPHEDSPRYIGIREDCCNNRYGLSEEDLRGYELLMDWHGRKVDPWYINKLLMD